MAMEDFTLGSIYDTLIVQTGAAGLTKVLIGDTTAGFRGGVAETINVAGSASTWGLQGISDGVGVAADATEWAILGTANFAGSVVGIDNVVSTITDYMSPSSGTLNAFQEMGEMTDRYIEDSLFLQFFGIKKKEFYCSAFCIVTSLMTCEQRNALYNAVTGFQELVARANGVVDATQQFFTAFNVGIAGLNTVTEAASGLVSGDFSSASGAMSTGTNLAGGLSLIKASVQSVEGIINTIMTTLNMSHVMNLISNAIPQIPNIWNLARNILFALQAMAMNIADEVLSKVLAPIEELIRKIQPQHCMNGFGGAIFNKIIETLRGYKAWIVTQIGELFTEFSSFNDLMKKFNLEAKHLLELSMFLEALGTLLERFGDFAFVCGLEPCEEDKTNKQNLGKFVDTVTGQTNVIDIQDLPTEPEDNIEEIAILMEDILDAPIDSVFATKDNITTIYSGFSGAPQQIVNMAKNLNLGENYSIATSGGDIKVVHTIKRHCGE